MLPKRCLWHWPSSSWTVKNFFFFSVQASLYTQWTKIVVGNLLKQQQNTFILNWLQTGTHPFVKILILKTTTWCSFVWVSEQRWISTGQQGALRTLRVIYCGLGHEIKYSSSPGSQSCFTEVKVVFRTFSSIPDKTTNVVHFFNIAKTRAMNCWYEEANSIRWGKRMENHTVKPPFRLSPGKSHNAKSSEHGKAFPKGVLVPSNHKLDEVLLPTVKKGDLLSPEKQQDRKIQMLNHYFLC